jgi:LacI family transcriptional regulator
MSVTIKKISEISGISRGTVDRVLNHRGRVSADKEQRVLKVAQELGYKPNLAGKALAARKKSFVIGVVLPSAGNPFFDDVIRGIRQAEKDLADYGVRVIIRTIKGYDSNRHLQEIDLLSPKVSALILTPLDNPDFVAKINALVDGGKCVVTMNTDVKNSRRLCYIGSDYDKGGRIACGLLGLLTGGRTKVGILTGSKEVLGHNQRIEGFCDIMRTKYPGFSITGIVETKDSDEIGYEAAKSLLAEHPETTSAFIVAAGTRGACKAISSFIEDRKEPFPVVSFDILPETREMMGRGIIQATISQQPFVQGFEAVKITFYYLVNNILPEGDAFIVKNEINILESL